MSIFPMQFARVEIGTCQAFCFTLPVQDIGRDDIKIYVEYSDPSAGEVRFNTWAQTVNGTVRYFIHTDSVKKKICDDLLHNIMHNINTSEEFYQQLHELLERLPR